MGASAEASPAGSGPEGVSMNLWKSIEEIPYAVKFWGACALVAAAFQFGFNG